MDSAQSSAYARRAATRFGSREFKDEMAVPSDGTTYDKVHPIATGKPMPPDAEPDPFSGLPQYDEYRRVFDR